MKNSHDFIDSIFIDSCDAETMCPSENIEKGLALDHCILRETPSGQEGSYY